MSAVRGLVRAVVMAQDLACKTFRPRHKPLFIRKRLRLLASNFCSDEHTFRGAYSSRALQLSSALVLGFTVSKEPLGPSRALAQCLVNMSNRSPTCTESED